MYLELTPFEALCEVLPKSERFDLLDYPAAVALLLEVDNTHASDELMHLRCDLRFHAVIPSFSHSCLSPSVLRWAFIFVLRRFGRPYVPLGQGQKRWTTDKPEAGDRHRSSEARAKAAPGFRGGKPFERVITLSV